MLLSLRRSLRHTTSRYHSNYGFSASSIRTVATKSNDANVNVVQSHGTLQAFCKAKGFVYSSSDIYGGLKGAFDYGPLGATLKRNLSDAWWHHFIKRRSDCVGLDSSIILDDKVWRASGHVDEFVDPLIECLECQHRHRADHLVSIEDRSSDPDAFVEELTSKIRSENIVCPTCATPLTSPAKWFNLLFETKYGGQLTYLRPETAQGIFINFPHILMSSRATIPFGVGQIGKAFRNEISPEKFLFRTREFEQLEMEYFVTPDHANVEFDKWVQETHSWLLSLGLDANRLRLVEHAESELPHYATRGLDIEYEFAHGWDELASIAHRGDYDLRRHADQLLHHDDSSELTGESEDVLSTTKKKKKKKQKKNPFLYKDPHTNASFIPHVVEVSIGLSRLFLTVLTDAYREEMVPGSDSESRVLLKLANHIAPIQFCVLPLMKKEPLMNVANNIFNQLRSYATTDMDISGSIGRRYRRHDEIGTPICITVDFESLENNTVTVRDRDSTTQRRIPITELVNSVKNSEKVTP